MSDAVRQFRLLPEGLAGAQQRVRSRFLIPQLFLFALFMLLGFFLTTRRNHDLRFVLTYAIILAAFLTYVAFVSPRRTRRSVDRTWATYVLEIGPDYLSRTQADTPDLRLPFSEISAIEHFPGRWVRVLGNSSQRAIGIPEEIERFPEVVATLSAIRPVTETRNDRSVKAFVFTLLGLAAFFGMAWAPTPQIAIPLAVLVSGALVWLFIYIQRNPNVNHRARRQSWIYLFLIVICLLKVLAVLHHV
jgi:NADH:ubiquinone oxidoreductase subunit 6 (subunit J)